MTAKFPQAGWASDSCLLTGPIGNSLAIGIGPVLISQTEWEHHIKNEFGYVLD